MFPCCIFSSSTAYTTHIPRLQQIQIQPSWKKNTVQQQQLDTCIIDV